ncbi:MAG: Na(+)-translocating NADH-quinone reductase subunit A [Prevotella sp.]|nr:Na(+)-translocating NADH-quinone reductase subunit A [Prevotella sp.]
MANIYKIRKGLDIKLKGKAEKIRLMPKPCEEYALCPDDFTGVIPKIVIKEGQHVKVGETLFVNKKSPEVTFSSPVSGIITAIVRGERRKIICIKIKADTQQEYIDFGKKDITVMDGASVKQMLLDAGLFGYINQLPYAVSTTPEITPRAIFISTLRDMPLAGEFEYELEGNEEAFQTGLTALSKIAKTYIGIGKKQMGCKALSEAKDVEVNIFDGPCPAGNVGVQINHLSPVNKGEVVWTVDPTVVIFLGRLLLNGKVDLRRTIAIAGSEVKKPAYVEVLVGHQLSSLLEDNIQKTSYHLRIIKGNPLTGKAVTRNDYVGAHTSEITIIPEGDDRAELFGWILPRINDYSHNRSYFTWLLGKNRTYTLDARIKGGERHMIMSGEYDKVMPMDIMGEYLIKAIIAGDIEKMEQLGIYEVSPEDFALAEFVDSSKLELQRIVREGLDILRKENE